MWYLSVSPTRMHTHARTHAPVSTRRRRLGCDNPRHLLPLVPLEGRSPRVALTSLALEPHTATRSLHARRLELCTSTEIQRSIVQYKGLSRPAGVALTSLALKPHAATRSLHTGRLELCTSTEIQRSIVQYKGLSRPAGVALTSLELEPQAATRSLHARRLELCTTQHRRGYDGTIVIRHSSIIPPRNLYHFEELVCSTVHFHRT